MTSLRTTLSILAAWSVAVAPPSPAQTVGEVQVTPETLTLPVGGRQTLFATAYDRQGNLIPNARFTFWSSDTLVATVGRNGAVVGVAPGLAKVEARIQGLQASTAVLITGPGGPADTAGASVLALEPASAALLPGEGLVVRARALREDGTPVAWGKVGWKSLDPRVAVVDSGGVVVAVAPGRTLIRATAAGGLVATAAVEVAAVEIALSRDSLVFGPGEVDTLRALVPGQGNREVRGAVRWQSSDTAVARVGPTGILNGVAPGRAVVAASWSGQERRAVVVVHREPRSLVVTPRPGAGPIQLPVRGIRRVSVTAEAADSTPIPEVRVSWEIGDTTVIAYDAGRGELTGRGVGTTTLTARLHGFDPVSWSVEVIPGDLALDRRRMGLGVGERDSLRALLLDQSGRPLGVAAELQWSSSAPEVLQVSPGGIVDGIRPGRSVVTASAPWGKRVTADVFVVADLLLASNRGGEVGIYQLRSTVTDTFRPVLADGFDNIQPALAPDRTRIAFSSNREGSYDLYLMEADGSGLRRLTTDPGDEGEPVWTPDGSRLIYTATTRGKPSQLYVLRPDGRPPQALTSGPGNAHSPAVSADGRSLAFVSTRDGNQEIYLMPVGGGSARRLTRTDQRESHARFLPDGDLLFAVERSGRSKGSRLVRLTVEDGELETLLETDEPIAGLSVSRDGQRMAYVVGRVTDARRGRAQFNLFVRPLAAGATPAQIALRPGEHVLNPAV